MRLEVKLSLSEGQLDQALADKVQNSSEFRLWLLGRTKFRDRAIDAVLLDEEQGRNRPVWWKHWWCRVPDLNEERETDVFLVFEDGQSNDRFALHIENKKGNGKFLDGQPEGYAARANFMMNQEKYLSYSDWETILIAPQSFYEANELKCDHFDVFICYEDISDFVTEFSEK